MFHMPIFERDDEDDDDDVVGSPLPSLMSSQGSAAAELSPVLSSPPLSSPSGSSPSLLTPPPPLAQLSSLTSSCVVEAPVLPAHQVASPQWKSRIATRPTQQAKKKAPTSMVQMRFIIAYYYF